MKIKTFICFFLNIIFLLNTYGLDLSAYQNSDGAITTYKNGTTVDPYFSIKALWASRKLNDFSQVETTSWINWLIVRQSSSGSFARFCLVKNTWQECNTADADDSVLALWIEILYENFSLKEMPVNLKKSIQLAEKHLFELKMPNGVYRVNKNYPNGLLMDNSEIYYSFKRISDINQKNGNKLIAQFYKVKAALLKAAIRKVFIANEDRILKWTTGDQTPTVFYPHVVAHLYPLMHGMAGADFDNYLNWDEWLVRYQFRWLSRSDDFSPWGLIALLALQMKSISVVRSWIENNKAVRETGHWTVLEESIFQGLSREVLK